MIGLEATTLQLLIEHTPAAVAIFDSEMHYLAASRRYIADYQLAGDALPGRSHYEVFPKISDRWKEIHRRCLNGATERGKEEPFPREDGTLDWMSWEIHPWHDAAGTIGGIVLFSEVTTAQKRFEPELAKQQRELEALIDSTDGSIWAVDTRYCLIAGNARYQRDVSAILGRSLAQGESVLLPAFSPEALAEWQGLYDRALQGEQFSVEVAIRYAQPLRLVEYHVSPIRAMGGTITGVTVFGRDVTARRRAEELIQAQRDVARLIGSGIASPDAWQVCLDAARRVSGMDCGLIHVFDVDDGTLRLTCSYGLDDASVQGMTRVARDNRSTQVVLTGKAHYFDAETTGAMQPDHGRLRCIAVVPIRYGEETIGTLSLASHRLDQVPEYVRQELETITVEVGNFAVYLRTQSALRASEEKYRSLVEAADAAIVMVDGDGRIHYANAQAAALGNATTADIIGKTMHELGSQELADADLALARKVMATNQGEVVEAVRGLSWYRSSIQPVRNAEGKATMVLFSATDITELKRVQQELVELNRTLEARVAERTAEVQDLYERAPAGYHSLDADGKVIRINQTELDWLGYTREEVVGRPVADFFTPASRAAFQIEYADFLARNWLRDQERELICKDGSIMQVLVNATAVRDEAGNYVMSRSTVFDNTRRKQAEETLRFANRELERAMRLKDEFLANMSHELRTPLNGILTLSEVILDGVYGPLPLRQERAMRHIDASGRHLLELINDLLDLSKVQAGKMVLETEPTMPDEVCQASMLFVQDLADKKDILLSYNNDDPSARVLADPRRLKQMLVNLLSNAVKFTPDGGRVHLQVLVEDDAHVIEFAVQDTGPGIAREDQARLFQPFLQLDASLAREHEGTGLGLALVRRLAEQHGGAVRVVSEGTPGKGSRFIITLPRAEPKPSS